MDGTSLVSFEDNAEYVFFIEFVGHQLDQAVQRTIDSLQSYTRAVRVLGTYPRASVTGVPTI